MNERMPILVVEDDPSLAELMRELLSDEFDVRVVATAEEALQECAIREPALILLDLGLPGMSGEAFAREFHAGGGRTPILVVSARPDARAVGRRIQAVGVLPKPFELGMLTTLVEHHTGAYST